MRSGCRIGSFTWLMDGFKMGVKTGSLLKIYSKAYEQHSLPLAEGPVVVSHCIEPFSKSYVEQTLIKQG